MGIELTPNDFEKKEESEEHLVLYHGTLGKDNIYKVYIYDCSWMIL